MSNVSIIKSKANPLKIIKHYNFKGINNSGDTIRSCCELHGGSNSSAFAINQETGIWYCHTGCKTGGDIINLVQRLEECDFLTAIKKIGEICNFEIDGIEFDTKEIKNYDDAFAWLLAVKYNTSNFPKYDLSNQNLLSITSYKHFNSDLLNHFNIKYCNEFKLEEEKVVFKKIVCPIIFNGKTIGASLRSTNSKDNIKWLHVPKGISTGSILYNYDNAMRSVEEGDLDHLVIVEGITDVWQYKLAGVENVVATFGSNLTNEQMLILQKSVSTIVLSYDGDEAGKNATKKAIKKCKSTFDIYSVEIPDNLDPGSIPFDTLKEIYNERRLAKDD